ncbi:hypothetical protein PRIPAC_88862 [Pristionchus pacificus]|uniref:Uncharacterized protein n=1 Tax=Pristionchus pacificus TaxID=54126 RepID=A0A2A6CZ37_PRIPA|nr:hypothetical protein PRIPAC_88862 [Pristionchus pacificus]|eukprot:PDM83388.1 hypothetical protein PRIPAC_35020 [Pristionchus pacificus]
MCFSINWKDQTSSLKSSSFLLKGKRGVSDGIVMSSLDISRREEEKGKTTEKIREEEGKTPQFTVIMVSIDDDSLQHRIKYVLGLDTE